MKKNLFIGLIVVLLISCNGGKLYNTYSVYEQFEMVAGEYSGTKGENEFSVKVLPNSENETEVYLENFANAYKVRAIINGDSIYIPNQKFPYYQSHVTIQGKGIILPDSIKYEYFSGGPQGQIICKGTGIKK